MTVTVPGDRIVTVPIEVEADRVELLDVPFRQEEPHRPQEWDRLRVAVLDAPPGGEAGFVDQSVVHGDTTALPERQDRREFVEDLVGTVEPSRDVLDPGRVVESGAHRFAERRVVRGRRHRPEQRPLVEHVFDRSRRLPRRRGSGRAPLGARTGQTGAMERIDDATDPRLSDYRELRDATARRKIEGDRFFIAEGPVAIERMLVSGHRVRSVLVSEQKYARLAELLDPLDAPVYVVDRTLLGDIVGFDLHRGAIAAADRLPHPGLTELAGTARRLAVLEGLNDPENLGAIARSARALGYDGLVLDPTCIDPYTRRTVRVSMGEILHLPTARTVAGDWPGAALARLHEAGFETWAMTPADDADDIWDLDVPERVAVVLGAEGPGLDHRTMRAATRRVRLPIARDVDSLNVAAAAAVTFAVTSRP